MTLTERGRVTAIANHQLPEAAFTELAEGGGGPATMRRLGEAQLSKHLMLLQAIAEAATGPGPGPVAFQAGYERLARIQASLPVAADWLLGLPHLGGWIHDTLIRLDQGGAADFGHFASLVAATAIRAGLPVDLDVPVRDGRVRLPGLGSLLVTRSVADAESAWIRLRCDDKVVTVAGLAIAAGRLVPDDGTQDPVPGWCGTPAVRSADSGLAWTVLLETGDPYLDRYTLPMRTTMTSEELADWRQRIRAAWRVVADRHRWAAEPLAEVISVIVPLTPRSGTDLVSATTPAAYGAFATSWPPDPVTLAETLVHEFQHVKLCGLLDLVPLIRWGDQRVYAPWRQDPRPARGLLQGVYAHLGIVRFWQAQQYAETDPDSLLRAQVLFARWRPAIEQAAATLRQTGSLTPAGARFAERLQAQGQRLASVSVPPEAARIAAEVALDHRLTWELRHVAVDPADVAGLAAAYRRGDAGPGQARTWVSQDVRKVDASLRSRLLNLRYLDPARYRELCGGGGILPLSEPDRLLLERRSEDAVRAYRTVIAGSADPQPDAWAGLALALHQLPPSPLQQPLATRLALMFEVHARLASSSDPLDLVSWFT
jgi:HEXXH motif-containing protein